MLIRYTALRSLIVGHAVGVTYDYSIGTTALAHNTKVEKVSQRAIGGATETIYSRTDREWTLAFEPVRAAGLAALKEFLESTDRGETFYLMLPGDVAPGTLCRRADDGYSFAEFLPLGDPATLDWFVTSITVRQV